MMVDDDMRKLLDDFNKQVLEAAVAKPVLRKAKRGGCTTWPVVSKLGLACDPSQVSEMNERNRKNGINATYRPDGACVIPDASDYKKLRRLEGFRDRDSYSE